MNGIFILLKHDIPKVGENQFWLPIAAFIERPTVNQLLKLDEFSNDLNIDHIVATKIEWSQKGYCAIIFDNDTQNKVTEYILTKTDSNGNIQTLDFDTNGYYKNALQNELIYVRNHPELFQEFIYTKKDE